MGTVRKLTGAQGQIDAANRNADAQLEASKQATQGQVQALNASATAAANAQKQAAARSQAEAAAAAAVSAPLAVAEVALDPAATESGAATARKKRAQFGKSFSSGVNI